MINHFIKKKNNCECSLVKTVFGIQLLNCQDYVLYIDKQYGKNLQKSKMNFNNKFV